MAKFIKSIVERINFLNRKGLCPYYSPDQLGGEVHAASMNLWKKYVAEFEKTQLISVYLDPFRDTEVVSLSGGIGTLVTSMGRYRTAVMVPNTRLRITLVDIGHWSNRANDTVRVPDADNPICKIEKDEIEVLPATFTSARVHFLNKPVRPVYAYTIVDDDYIYDDASSVDIEWDETIHDEITGRVFAKLGLSQREVNLIQYSNTEQQKEGK